MDRLLFGDNQFFGVNHMSEEKARAQAMRFQDTSAIIKVLDADLSRDDRMKIFGQNFRKLAAPIFRKKGWKIEV